MARELIVKPLGLVTRPNIYGQYPVGGMLQAANLVMRAPGIIESAPALVSGASFGASNEVVHGLWMIPSAVISVSLSGSTWSVRRNTAAFSNPFFSVPITYSATGRIQFVESRSRVCINSENTGLLVVDDPGAAGALRKAGIMQSRCFAGSGPGTNSVALNNNDVVGYASVIRRTYSDGYELVSAPSPIMVVWNSTGAANNPTAIVQCSVVNGHQVGDVAEVYRTDVVPNGNYSTDPGTTLKLIASVTLTSADLAVGSVTIEDSQVPGPLGVTGGKELYTNPGQRGALGRHRIPNIAKAMALFKGYAFLGNVTQRPLLQFSIPGSISTTQIAGFNTAWFRLHGVGLRRGTGTITSGSASITGVSATDMLGIRAGQDLFGVAPASFPAGTRVLSAVGTTITATNLANGTGTIFSASDVFELDGVRIPVQGSPGLFLANMGSSSLYEITTSENVVSGQDLAVGIRKISWFVEPSQWNGPNGNQILIRATNGANYDPPLTELANPASTILPTTIKNALQWSDDAQPESFPAPNEAQVGNAEIIAFEPTRDALWIFCTDGLLRLSGAGGQWRVDTADTTLVLASPRASCVLKEAVYAYTNQGLVRVTDAGTEHLSEQIIGDLLPGSEYVETASIIVEANEAEDEIVIRLSASEVYVYSVREQTFTTVNHLDVTAMCYARYPVSGQPALAVGQSPSGSAPSYSLWNATSSYLAPTARFHPLFAQDPLASKQWIDGTYIFDLASAAKSLTPAWNNVASPASPLKNTGQFFNESRANFGVPRRAAIGHTLAPGFSFGALSTSTKFYALSMRFRQLSEQNLHR